MAIIIDNSTIGVYKIAMANAIAELGIFLRDNQDKATAFASTTGAPVLEVATRPDISPTLAILLTAGGIAAQTFMNYVDMAYAQFEKGKADDVRSQLAAIAEESPSTA